MNVLQIVADGSPGGGTTHVLQILRARKGLVSFGLVTQNDSHLLREARSLGIPSYGVDFFSSRLDVRIALRLRRIIQEFEPRIVHVHGGRAGFFHALGLTRTPTTYTVHGYHFVCNKGLALWLAENAERLASRRAQHVFFVSEHDRREARERGLLPASTRRSVVYNGVPLSEPAVPGRSEPGRVGFVGRLVYPKDPLLFLDVLERLPGYTGIIVGGGELEDEVSGEIKRRGLYRARMLGELSHAEALLELANLSVLVVTSRWEAFGMVAAESAALGVPVVATKVGGLSEVIEHGKSGLLVENRSADDLARAVVRIEEDTVLRERVVENARDRVRMLFSEELMLSRIHEIYQQMAPE